MLGGVGDGEDGKGNLFFNSPYSRKKVSIASLAGQSCFFFIEVCSEIYNSVHRLEPSQVLVSLGNDILTRKVR